MFLINTTTLELMWFNRPHGDTPPYAVLSHVWGHDEISHQDLTGGKDLFIHKKSYPKLMEACRIAQEQGLGYLWYDSCCIDFTDAKEPFRSIASQFQVFKSAKICIAYLCDVLAPSTNATTGGIVTSVPPVLRHSRWFTRSWLLQELIAPPRLEFYSHDWHYIGERSELRWLLYDITSIDPYILAGGDLSRIPVARKILWATGRTAPRAEDVAYALYGLFDVHRRPLYGEGLENAFYKLQEKIAKKTEDPSLLAWRDDWAEKYSTWDKCKDIFQSSQLRGLLAKSPEDFSHCGRLFPPLGTGGQDDYSRADQEEYNHGGSSDDWDVSSVASFGSSTTLVGSSASATVNSGLTKAVTFFLDTDTVYPLLEAAVKKPSIGADRLRRNLVRLLRKLGLELTLEASTKDESLAAAFLRQHRIPIAWAVIARASEKYLESVPSVPLMSTGEDFPEALGTSAPEAQGDERAETFASHEDDEDSGPEGDGTAAKEEQAQEDLDFSSISAFIFESAAFASMARQLADFVHPTFDSQAKKLLAKTLEGKSLEVGCYWSNMKIKMQIVLVELEEARPERIMLDVEGKTKGIDRLKIWIESVTKETWNWWPLQPPKYPMKPTETRIGWRCRCGAVRHVVPADFASSIALLLQRYPFTTRQHASPESTSESHSPGQVPPERGSSSYLGTRSIKTTAGSDATTKSPLSAVQGKGVNRKTTPSKGRFIFLVATTSRHRLKQLHSLSLGAEGFGQELRVAYYELKGFWRYWFSPYRFSHCDFVRFEKFCRDGFAHRGLEMPDVTQKDYYYAPRPALHDPPISPEEFSHIYHHKTRDSSPTWALLPVFSGVESLSDNSVECIPQRYHYLDERSNCKEDFWGLHVRERRSAAMTSSYIILSLSPFLLFCVLYLLGFISGDIQNATTPLALALTSLGLLLGSLIKA